MNPCAYKIIRVDGTETVHEGKPTIREITRLIGCDGLDTVTIDRKRQTVMFVDDTGMLDGKPVNAKATALYHSVCKTGTVWARSPAQLVGLCVVVIRHTARIHQTSPAAWPGSTSIRTGY